MPRWVLGLKPSICISIYFLLDAKLQSRQLPYPTDVSAQNHASIAALGSCSASACGANILSSANWAAIADRKLQHETTKKLQLQRKEDVES